MSTENRSSLDKLEMFLITSIMLPGRAIKTSLSFLINYDEIMLAAISTEEDRDKKNYVKPVTCYLMIASLLVFALNLFNNIPQVKPDGKLERFILDIPEILRADSIFGWVMTLLPFVFLLVAFSWMLYYNWAKKQFGIEYRVVLQVSSYYLSSLLVFFIPLILLSGSSDYVATEKFSIINVLSNRGESIMVVLIGIWFLFSFLSLTMVIKKISEISGLTALGVSFSAITMFGLFSIFSLIVFRNYLG